jgi:transcriptional accessory protein Tex/SPT6
MRIAGQVSPGACPPLSPDNQPRAGRVQQLVDSIANMQTDIKNDAKQMDKKNADMRPKVDALLNKNGLDSIDDLIKKAMAQMTDDERKQFEAVSRFSMEYELLSTR